MKILENDEYKTVIMEDMIHEVYGGIIVDHGPPLEELFKGGSYYLYIYWVFVRAIII